MSVGAVPIEEACFWIAGRRRESDPPLEGRREADVAIVGAGLTGLWAANHLKGLDRSQEVVVLEREVAAYGASGRNAGILGEGIDHSHESAVAHFGRDDAQALARLGQENLRELTGFLRQRSIDCDLESNGHLLVALSCAQFDELRRELAIAHDLGISHYRLLDGAEARSEIHCPRYEGALLNPHGAILDPVKLVDGLKREAASAGVTFFERTPVLGFQRVGGAVRVKAAAGEVLARKVVLATNAYTHQLVPQLIHRYIPLYDYILVSEPLTIEQRATMGWRGRQGVTDARHFFKYYRLTTDHRVLWGTSEAVYYRGNRVDGGCDHSPRHYEALRESFRRHFPSLADLEFPFAWGGPICSTTRLTPFFGATAGGRVLYGLGYTGHGLGTTHLAGKILAHLALEHSTTLRDLALVRRKPLPYPPEPLRSIAVRAVSRALRRVDGGGRAGWLLRLLDAFGIGFSS